MTIEERVKDIMATAQRQTAVTDAWAKGYHDIMRSVVQHRNCHDNTMPRQPAPIRRAYYNGAMIAAMEQHVAMPQEPPIDPTRLQVIV